MQPVKAKALEWIAKERPHLYGRFTELTDAEIAVMDLLVKPGPMVDIARKLKIDARTLSTHKRNLLSKLGLQDRVDLVLWAAREKLNIAWLAMAIKSRERK